jgi:L-alanine-DL-glutamate epimerase-like enolase superfamily enzyme
MSVATEVAVERVDVSAYTIPTDEPESDGTLEWDSTTIVVVEARGGGETGLGYSYAHKAAATVIVDTLAKAVEGKALDPGALWEEMGRQLRNAGRPGIGFTAVSAVDTALWDLQARLLRVPLVTALGSARERAEIYGSGGFTSYSRDRLSEQLGGWVADGIPRVKMKVGRDDGADPARLETARDAIGNGAALYVDANGAYSRKQALAWAERYAFEWDVTWFEEPVSSADFEGLRLLRDRVPAGMDVAAGEYAYVPADFRNLLECVDCLQVDVTRGGGFTGFLRAAALAAAHGLDVSAHCAPQLSAHVCCAVPRFRHIEYFHDHVRIESLLFDGVLEPDDGALRPDRSRPGNGLELKRADAERFAA